MDFLNNITKQLEAKSDNISKLTALKQPAKMDEGKQALEVDIGELFDF